MKTKSLTKKKFVSHYASLKKKKEMGFPITLGDIDYKPITKRIRRLLERR